MYLFAYCKEDVDAEKCLSEYKKLTNLDTMYSGKKYIFFHPKSIRGEAVIRLKERFKLDLVICAGDSQIDVSMLNVADIAIVPSAVMAEKIIRAVTYI